MKNLFTLSIAITAAFLLTSCSEDADLVSVNDNNTESTSVEDVKETHDSATKLFDAKSEVAQTLDLDKIIEDYEKNLKKGAANQKSIAVPIYDGVFDIYAGRWFNVKHSTYYMGYYTYSVTMVDLGGDPDVSIWGKDIHDSYDPYRLVRRRTGCSDYYCSEEYSWYTQNSFRYYEEYGVISVYADQGRNARFRLIIERIS